MVILSNSGLKMNRKNQPILPGEQNMRGVFAVTPYLLLKMAVL